MRIFDSRSTNEAYESFIIVFQDIYNRNFPLVKQSRARQRDKKWITKELRESIRKKNILLRHKIDRPTDSHIQRFKSYNKILQRRLDDAENRYYLEMFNSKFDSNFKFWTVFGKIINPNKYMKREILTKIICDGQEISEPKEISKMFNNHFATVGKKLSQKFQNRSNFKRFLKLNLINSIYFQPIIENENLKEINHLKVNKSPGPDGIPPKVIKVAGKYIVSVLTHIYNLTIDTGEYPDLLKISKVIALYKKGSKLITENYRPISLLNIFDKILEKLLYKRLVSFLNIYDALFQFQFGFREGYSTTLALTEITDKIKFAIDNNEYVVGVFLDLCKAFDTVDHSILLQKLKYYGIRGKPHSLLSSYLNNRSQFTVINDVQSDTMPVSFGVPQGSVLGPLLFLIYINDIRYCIPEEHIRLFADDTGIFVVGKTLNSTIAAMQHLLNLLEKWFESNKLTISVPKCAVVIFHGKNKILPANLPVLYLNGTEIHRVSSFKYIGVILDEKLTWEPHVNHICTRLNRYFGIFYHIRNKIPQQMARQLYFSTVFPHVNYAMEVYGSCALKLTQRLQSKQNQLLKVLTKKDRLFATNELHFSHKILKINDLYKTKVLCFVHACLNQNTLNMFHNYFPLLSYTHDHYTRNECDIVIPRSRTNQGSSTVKFKGASFWNNNEVAKENLNHSKNIFKNRITSVFLNEYQSE